MAIQEKTSLLGYDNAYHLLRRATFSLDKSLIDTYALKTPAQALVDLFAPRATGLPESPLYLGQSYIPTVLDPTPSTSFVGNSRQRYLWMYEFMKDQTIHSKTSLLLHLFFTTSDEINTNWVNYDYIQLLRWHTTGSLKELAIRVTRDVKVLAYLGNSNSSYLTAPNENYAREFLELFTILKGEQIASGNYTTYTEDDVIAAARLLTGHYGELANTENTNRLSNLDPVTNIPRGTIVPINHDPGNKTFSFNGGTTITGGSTANDVTRELGEFVDLVFNERATAESYSRRIYRFFVGRTITAAIETDIISDLADDLLANNYNIQSAITLLLTSTHFYDEDDSIIGDNVIGALVKSPLDLILQLYTVFEVATPNYTTQTKMANDFIRTAIFDTATNCGFSFLAPIDVNGYPAYSQETFYDKYWVTTATLRPRYQFIIDKLLDGETVADGTNSFVIQLDIADFVRNSGHFSAPETAATLLQDFFNLLFVSTPTGDRYTLFETALLGGLSATSWMFTWQAYMSTNDASSVTIALERLVRSLIKSSEFQIM